MHRFFILIICLFLFQACSAQIIMGYQYGVGADTDALTNQVEHGFGFSFAQRVPATTGILYVSLMLKTGPFRYQADSMSTEIGRKYIRTAFSMDLEYGLFNKRFQPIVGLDLRYGGVRPSGGEGSSTFFAAGPIVGLRYYLSRRLALDGTYRYIYFLEPEEDALVDLKPLNLFSIGFRYGIYIKK